MRRRRPHRRGHALPHPGGARGGAPGVPLLRLRRAPAAARGARAEGAPALPDTGEGADGIYRRSES